MATNLSQKCPTCGAELFWTASKNCFECEYCGDSFTLAQLEAEGLSKPIDENKVEKHEEVEKGEYTETTDGTVGNDFVKYTCSHCGAEIITDRATAATLCVYCGNSVIMSEQIIKDFAPDLVIPFKVDKSKVMDAFREFSKKPLTPNDFNCDKIVDKMQGVYIPFWLYSGKCHGTMNAEGINKRTYRSGGYEYTERKHYAVLRDGTLSFDMIPVDASSKTDNDAMDSIEPFDYSEFKPFNPSYLSGFLAERYDEDNRKCYPRAKLRIENTTTEELLKTCHYNETKVFDCQRQVDIEKTQYALLPTWLLYTTYKDKKYFFAMNGQTGKFIGNLPIDKVKLAVYSIFGAIGGSIVGYALGVLGLFS